MVYQLELTYVIDYKQGLFLIKVKVKSRPFAPKTTLRLTAFPFHLLYGTSKRVLARRQAQRRLASFSFEMFILCWP